MLFSLRQFKIAVLGASLVLFTAHAARAGGNCSNTSVGLIPLIDLGTDLYQGYQGGLYPEGENVRPEPYRSDGIAIANSIKPLNSSGQVDETNGKIGLVTIGMSNTSAESKAFLSIGNADPLKNPKVVLVNGAQSGKSADKIADPNDDYWEGHVMPQVARGGITAEQVQVAWVKEATPMPSEPFPAEAVELQGFLEDIARNLLAFFPNIKIVYYSSRIYAGYATGDLNPEPHAYETGFSVKWMIEKQINGDPNLNYDPEQGEVKAPYVTWGPYLWADGMNPRSDGLIWECDDLANDGTHPSDAGSDKVGTLLVEFLQTDETATPWYLEDTATDVQTEAGPPSEFRLGPNFPNPFRSATTIHYQLPADAFVTLRVYNLLGQEVANLVSGHRSAGEHLVRWNGLDRQQRPVVPGVYFVTLWRSGADGPTEMLARRKMIVVR